MSGKAWNKRRCRRTLRRELKHAEGYTKVGARFSRFHWGDGITKGDLVGGSKWSTDF